jgi:predicted enzyme related to lactoylglutathione lyase
MAITHPPRIRFESSAPILRVDDLDASLDFYVNLLGFTKASWGNPEFTRVSRDHASIYLSRSQGLGAAWVWITVEDAEKLHQELVARGVTVRLTPTRFPWGIELQVEDPDGNVLRLGSDVRE